MESKSIHERVNGAFTVVYFQCNVKNGKLLNDILIYIIIWTIKVCLPSCLKCLIFLEQLSRDKLEFSDANLLPSYILR